MEFEVAVTVEAVARVVIGNDGIPRVIGIEIKQCKIADADADKAASP